MKIGNLEVYGVIYKITNLVNDKVYIGQTIHGFNKRYNYKGVDIERVYLVHKTNKKKGKYYNEYLFNSIAKYGFDNFKVDKIFDTAFSQDELNIKEQCWISIYKSHTYKYGYNRNYGGHSGIPTEESKSLISINHANVQGRDNANAIINEVVAEQIKIKLSQGISIKKISDEFKLSCSLIGNIKGMKSWEFIRQDLNESILKYYKKINSKYQQEINRLNIINAYEKELNKKEISDLYPKISKNTINTVIKKYCKEKDISPRKVIDFTNRNENIICLLLDGFTRKEISNKLNIKKSIVDGVIRRYNNKINKETI